jgi:hypothetical protein
VGVVPITAVSVRARRAGPYATMGILAQRADVSYLSWVQTSPKRVIKVRSAELNMLHRLPPRDATSI